MQVWGVESCLEAMVLQDRWWHLKGLLGRMLMTTHTCQNRFDIPTSLCTPQNRMTAGSRVTAGNQIRYTIYRQVLLYVLIFLAETCCKVQKTILKYKNVTRENAARFLLAELMLAAEQTQHYLILSSVLGWRNWPITARHETRKHVVYKILVDACDGWMLWSRLWLVSLTDCTSAVIRFSPFPLSYFCTSAGVFECIYIHM